MFKTESTEPKLENTQGLNNAPEKKEKKPIRQVVGAVVIDTENKRVLMLSSNKFENVYCLPKGICETEEETHEEAIIRCLHDEAGLQVEKVNRRIGTYTEANKRGKIVAHHWMYEVLDPTLMESWPALDREREWFSFRDAIGYSSEHHISRLALNNSKLGKS
ncbi:hypothetical protein K501DRAFT_172461 [Backusella circina FSU 941]|nr:hypothetical protein K501DRAFT_172461 [Backusella circina FSU 941]